MYNAFNGIEFNSIVLLAPIFYPIIWENSSDTTMVLLTIYFEIPSKQSSDDLRLIDSFPPARIRRCPRSRNIPFFHQERYEV